MLAPLRHLYGRAPQTVDTPRPFLSLLCIPRTRPRPARRTILPLASVLTPNQFEAELLSGARVTDEASALAACDALHAAGPHTVVITSAEWAASGGSPEAGGSGAEAAGGSSPEAGGSGGGEAGGSSTEEGGGGGGGGEAGGAESGGGGSGKFITLVASTRLPQLPGSPAALRVRIPKLDAYFTGTGERHDEMR